ncbi:MAG: hypothetical protein ABJN26_26515 [Stappiaceae bacterium]
MDPIRSSNNPRLTSLPDPVPPKRQTSCVLHVLVPLCLLLCFSAPTGAQESDGSSVVSRVTPPQSESSQNYKSLADGNDISNEAIYADKVQGTLSDERTIKETKKRSSREPLFIPKLDGGIGVGFAIFAVIALLLLWLKFGGSGVLLSGEPRDVKKKQKAPDSWNIAAQEAELDGEDLLSRLASMSDRSEALAKLLRHCLLSAGEETETRFARSDTEREAFARLPAELSHYAALKALLRDAELAHYGGRPVSDEVFSRSLQLGRSLLSTHGTHSHA